MTRLIIFDFDGTLGDTRRTIVTTLQQTMQALGLTVRDEDTCASTIGLKLGDCFRKMFPELDDNRILLEEQLCKGIEVEPPVGPYVTAG